jgi:hypothetical protein
VLHTHSRSCISSVTDCSLRSTIRLTEAVTMVSGRRRT